MGLKNEIGNTNGELYMKEFMQGYRPLNIMAQLKTFLYILIFFAACLIIPLYFQQLQMCLLHFLVKETAPTFQSSVQKKMGT